MREISQTQIQEISHRIKESGYLDWLKEEMRRQAFVMFTTTPVADLEGLKIARMQHDCINNVERIINRQTIAKS